MATQYRGMRHNARYKTNDLEDMPFSNSATRSHEQDEILEWLEQLPAIAAPVILPAIHDVSPKLPVIGCGLVRSLCQIDELVRQGIVSISVSEPSLWII